MRNWKLWLTLILPILFVNIMCETKNDDEIFQHLHNHNGSENYSIDTIFSKNTKYMTSFWIQLLNN